MYKVTTIVKGRTVRKVETETPMVKFFDMLAKDENAGKITTAQAVTFAKTCVGARRVGYIGGVDVSAGERRYKITKL